MRSATSVALIEAFSRAASVASEPVLDLRRSASINAPLASPALVLGTGWFHTEPWGVWSIGSRSTITAHLIRRDQEAGIKAGCNGCHGPLAFLAGDIPPERPAEGTRANEGVSCALCHSITGHEGDAQFNFNFTVAPGEAYHGDRIFRLPYLDPEGRMTVAQWNAAGFGPDLPLAPLAAKTETFTWVVPDRVSGDVTATVWYDMVVSSVAEHLGIPCELGCPVEMAQHTTRFTVAKE